MSGVCIRILDARFMRYNTNIRGTRVGVESAGGSVSGRWNLVASVEIRGCPGPTVPLGWLYVWYFGTRGLWYLRIFGSWDSIGTSGKQKSRFVRFCESFGSPDIS